MSSDSQQEDSGRRAVITKEMIKAMKQPYRHHFSAYCKERKQVTQRLPAQVWRSVYADVKDRPGFHGLKEDSLKKRLKVALSCEAANISSRSDAADLAAIVTAGVDSSGPQEVVAEPVPERSSGIQETSHSQKSAGDVGVQQVPVSTTQLTKHTSIINHMRTSSPSDRSWPESCDDVPLQAQSTYIASTLEALLVQYTRRNEENLQAKKRKLDILENSYILQKARLEIEEKHYRRQYEINKRRLEIEQANSKLKRLVLLHKHGILDKNQLLSKLNPGS